MTVAESPVVDLVIAVHDSSRPLQRALDSLFDSGLDTGTELRITVVCHDIAAAEIEAVISVQARDSVRFLEWRDGVRSPAGPFAHGIAAATAKYVSIMGSDDFLEPGALRAWLELAEHGQLTVLMPPERHAAGSRIRTPPVRPWRRGRLDGVKDRLAYRTAPLGLIRRDAISRLNLGFSTGLATGEDQLFSLGLWFSDERIAYGRGCPAYVVGADAQTRVTMTSRSAEKELQAVSDLLSGPWFAILPDRVRRAIVIKSVRVHVFAAASGRSETGSWTPEDRRYLRDLLASCSDAAPGFERPLSIADRRLVDGLSELSVPEHELVRRSRARRKFGTPATLFTRGLAAQFDVEGPLRFSIASALL